MAIPKHSYVLCCACFLAAVQVEALRARPDVQVVTVSRDNRDALVQRLSSQLRQALQQLPGAGASSGPADGVISSQ